MRFFMKKGDFEVVIFVTNWLLKYVFVTNVILNFLKPVILNMRNFWINVDFCPSVRCREKALTLLKLASDSGRRRPSSRFALLVTQTLPKFIWEEELLVLLHILNWYFWFDCKKEQTVIEVGPFFSNVGPKFVATTGKARGDTWRNYKVLFSTLLENFKFCPKINFQKKMTKLWIWIFLPKINTLFWSLYIDLIF